MKESISGVWSNVLAGTRLARFRAVSARDFRVSSGQLVLLILLDTLLSFSSDWLTSLPDPVFHMAGLAQNGFDTLMLMLAATLAALWLTRNGKPLTLAVMVFSTMPLLTATVTVFYLLAWLLPEEAAWMYSAIYLFCLGLVITVIARPVFLYASDTRFRLIKVPAVFICIWFLPVWYFAQENYFWYSGSGDGTGVDEYAAYRNLDVEAVYYRQHDLLARTLEQLLPERPQSEDLYFVGFAGYARQNVFLNEIRFARDLFDRRFDTAGRSLILVNNLSTQDSVPLASHSNLKIALAGIGDKIDRENDILVMFLTSHGSKKELAVDFWPMRLNDLTPPELRKALDDSGIKWRVIMISACHSGTFIESLRDPYTMVLTAAATERTSFGCEDNNEMTYFGEALLKHQLSTSHSFEQAFSLAAAEIAAREHAEELEPSSPQLYIGAEIRAKLAALAETLETRLETDRHKLANSAGTAPAFMDRPPEHPAAGRLPDTPDRRL